MQDVAHIVVSDEANPLPAPSQSEGEDTVSTHVLVAEAQVAQLRELSRRTRIAQSVYLREAVEDLLIKYEKEER